MKICQDQSVCLCQPVFTVQADMAETFSNTFSFLLQEHG